MSEQENPDHFPTQEGGTVPAEEIFPGAMWHYLIVAEAKNLPPVIRESLTAFLVRAAYETVGQGHFNLWQNPESIAMRVHTIPPKMDLFSQRFRETVAVWAPGRIPRINVYTMTYTKKL